ncbi:MAG: tRNA threonylcarbamoyladenosine dehydratase [Chitinispirillaceae bacterium]|nr:tRNA threonylcarbamoyladenosine dehydratase [Chitinispirillaceae bacterium]
MERDSTFDRLQLLTGDRALLLLRRTSVILFGVGGVGSWCAEALVRSGIGRLTMVDADLICRTNINRQVQATAATVGGVKVNELATRMRKINPHAEIIALQEIYTPGSADRFRLATYDYVIDAIDSLSAKVDLIAGATEAGARIFTALGASCKIDPSRIRVGPLRESHGCHLGKLVRKRLRRRNCNGDPLCVYSEEQPPVREGGNGCGGDAEGDPESVNGGEDGAVSDNKQRSIKKRINGSVVHITGSFGFFLAGLVVQDVVRRAGEGKKPESGVRSQKKEERE